MTYNELETKTIVTLSQVTFDVTDLDLLRRFYDAVGNTAATHQTMATLSLLSELLGDPMHSGPMQTIAYHVAAMEAGET